MHFGEPVSETPPSVFRTDARPTALADGVPAVTRALAAHFDVALPLLTATTWLLFLIQKTPRGGGEWVGGLDQGVGPPPGRGSQARGPGLVSAQIAENFWGNALRCP